MSDRSLAWHQSTLELIGNCSWKYFLTYVLKIDDPANASALVGTNVHSAIEAYEVARMNGITLPLADMLQLSVQDLDDTSSTMARAAVTNWYSSALKNKDKSHRDWLAMMTPVTIEGYFNFKLVNGAMPIGGTIDGVYLTLDSRYHVVDLKTSKDMSRWKLDGEGKRLQATMYSVAVQLEYSLDYLPAVTYTVARTNSVGETARRVTIQPDLEDVRVLGNRIREAQQIVDTERYTKNTSWHLCDARWCSHYQGCMVDGTLTGTTVKLKQKHTVPVTGLPSVQYIETTTLGGTQ